MPQTNDFNFFLPLDICKSESMDSEDEPEMRIAGYASTCDEDRQGDSIVQKGLDISDFVDSGWFNMDHDNSKILGYPDKDKTYIDNHGFHVEGTLLNTPMAKSIWDTCVALKKSNAPRKMGFSVEGKILQRDSVGKITKAKVYNVAITPNPVNLNATFEALCKSFSDELLDKSMEAGYFTNVGDVNSGGCMKEEDLESAFRTLAKAFGGNEEASSALAVLQKCLNKSMNMDELVLYFQLSKGLTRQQSLDLVQEINDKEAKIHE